MYLKYVFNRVINTLANTHIVCNLTRIISLINNLNNINIKKKTK